MKTKHFTLKDNNDDRIYVTFIFKQEEESEKIKKVVEYTIEKYPEDWEFGDIEEAIENNFDVIYTLYDNDEENTLYI